MTVLYRKGDKILVELWAAADYDDSSDVWVTAVAHEDRIDNTPTLVLLQPSQVRSVVTERRIRIGATVVNKNVVDKTDPMNHKEVVSIIVTQSGVRKLLLREADGNMVLQLAASHELAPLPAIAAEAGVAVDGMTSGGDGTVT